MKKKFIPAAVLLLAAAVILAVRLKPETPDISIDEPPVAEEATATAGENIFPEEENEEAAPSEPPSVLIESAEGEAPATAATVPTTPRPTAPAASMEPVPAVMPTPESTPASELGESTPSPTPSPTPTPKPTKTPAPSNTGENVIGGVLFG